MLYSDVIDILMNVSDKQMTVSEFQEVLEGLREHDGELRMRDIKLATSKKPLMMQTFCYKIYRTWEGKEPEQLTDWQFKTVIGKTKKELFEKAEYSARKRAGDFGGNCYYDDFSWDEPTEYKREV